MVLLNDETKRSVTKASVNGNSTAMGRARLERELFAGRYRPGQSVQLREIATKYGLDEQSVLKAFAEFQAVGIAKLAGNFRQSFKPQNPRKCKMPMRSEQVWKKLPGALPPPR